MSGKTFARIAELAQTIGVPLEELLLALEYVPQTACNAKTVEEAERAYLDALLDSEEKFAAIVRWEELSAQAVAAASVIDEDLREAYDEAPVWGAARRAALQKMWEIFERQK